MALPHTRLHLTIEIVENVTSPTKTIRQLDELGASYLQTEHLQTSSSSIFRGYWPFLSSFEI